MLFAFFVLFGLPLLLLCGAELCTRYFAPAPPATFFIKAEQKNGSQVYRTNFQAVTRFFPGKLARKPLAETFSAAKEPDTFRIFILGESAARGESLADFSFARIMEAVLQKNNPERKIEVINTGIPAINSWIINEFAEEICSYHPDLVIIFAGNNEFIGPFGPATTFTSSNSRTASKIGIFASNLHIIQHLKSQALPENLRKGWRGLDMFSSNLINPRDPRIEQCYENWKLNLEEILGQFRRHSIPAVVCSVPANLTDCPPFASSFVDEAGKKALESLKNLFTESNWPELSRIFTANQPGLKDHALANWLFAHSAANLGQAEKAREHFISALELDCFRVRTTPAMNRISADAAKANGAHFIDMVAAFAEASPLQVTGRGLIYDHVHLTESGNYLVAARLFQDMQVRQIFTEKGLSTDFPAENEALSLIGFSQNDRAQHLSHSVAAMKEAPFTMLFNHKSEVELRKRQLAETLDSLDFGTAIHATNDAIRLFPKNSRLTMRLAQLFAQTGQFDEAIIYFNKTIELNNFNPDAFNNLGTIYLKTSQPEKAEPLFLQAITISPDFADAYFNLGLSAAAQKNNEKALKYYNEALMVEPSFSAALRNTANIFFDLKNFERAEIYYNQAYSADPGDLHSLIGAGNSQSARGLFTEARNSYRLATIEFPDQPEGFYSLARLLEQAESVDTALPYYLDALNRLKHKPSADKVFSLIAAGKIATGPAELQKIAQSCCVAGEFSDPWHLQLLGVAHAELGELDEARGYLHRALELARKANETALVRDLEDSLRTLAEK